MDAIPALADRGKASLLRWYATLDNELAESQYTAGDTFSIADITALCTADFAAGAARCPVPDECANVKRWHAEVSARPNASA